MAALKTQSTNFALDAVAICTLFATEKPGTVGPVMTTDHSC
jgi:hypothetical protein